MIISLVQFLHSSERFQLIRVHSHVHYADLMTLRHLPVRFSRTAMSQTEHYEYCNSRVCNRCLVVGCAAKKSQVFGQPTSTLPAGTPLVLFSLRERNCMIGIISSRLLGMPSPERLYLLISTCENTFFSFSSEASVTDEALEPAQTRIGVWHF